MRWTLPLLLLAGCATTTQPAAPNDSIFHYIRSNRDDSEAENIVVFRPTRTEVAVYKWVERCTTAAYVTAVMDPAAWEAVRLDAGKVGKAGEQAKFGFMTLDPATRTLRASLDTPDGAITDSVRVPDRPWRLFDYDLADLNAALQELRPERSFSFGLALVWPQEGSSRFFSYLGRVDATHVRDGQHLGRMARRFDLRLTGPKQSTGTLWIDAGRGFIVDAELGAPNHPGYKDFRLRLDRIESGGQRAWEALLKRHYAGCPAGN